MKKFTLTSLFLVALSISQVILASDAIRFKEQYSYFLSSIATNDMKNIHNPSTTNLHELSSNNGSLIALGVGRRFQYFRVELEYIKTDNNLSKKTLTQTNDEIALTNSEFSTKGVYLNSYLDFELDYYDLRSYIGLGLGQMSSKIEEQGNSYSDNNHTAYQFKAGLTSSINQNLDWFLGYRYIEFDDFEGDGANYLSPKIYSFETGFRFIF